MPSVHTAQKGGPDAPGQWVLLDTLQVGPRRGRGGPQPVACAPHPHSRRSWRRCTQLSFRSWSGTQLSTNTHACAHTHVYTHMYTLTCMYPCAQSCHTHTSVCTPHAGLPEGHGPWRYCPSLSPAWPPDSPHPYTSPFCKECPSLRSLGEWPQLSCTCPPSEQACPVPALLPWLSWRVGSRGLTAWAGRGSPCIEVGEKGVQFVWAEE